MTARQLFRSGMTVGRDMMGTMSNGCDFDSSACLVHRRMDDCKPPQGYFLEHCRDALLFGLSGAIMSNNIFCCAFFVQNAPKVV
ncbi:hypothetical protein [Butyricicoccus intestinisimiae]|uniref:hypothetical protein n=1 Tax=Butyricicoccus intestinisimiae TaxID=2841509 RepID=UPI0038B361D7